HSKERSVDIPFPQQGPDGNIVPITTNLEDNASRPEDSDEVAKRLVDGRRAINESEELLLAGVYQRELMDHRLPGPILAVAVEVFDLPPGGRGKLIEDRLRHVRLCDRPIEIAEDRALGGHVLIVLVRCADSRPFSPRFEVRPLRRGQSINAKSHAPELEPCDLEIESGGDRIHAGPERGGVVREIAGGDRLDW